KNKSAKWYYFRLRLSCDLDDLDDLTALMATFPVRVFCLQSTKKWEGRRYIPLTTEMMDVLEPLFEVSKWKIMHASVCLESTHYIDRRFFEFMRRTQMMSAYKCDWSKWTCKHPMRYRKMPYTRTG
ncbi:hypothetical protein PRIPAC_94922, partial [Pristionchus pacificus]